MTLPKVLARLRERKNAELFDGHPYLSCAELDALLDVAEVMERFIPGPNVIQWERRELDLRKAFHRLCLAVTGSEGADETS